MQTAPTDAALGYHLAHNHYPAISESMIATCREAIEAVNDSEPNRMISYVNGKAQAWAIVEVIHLSEFLEVDHD